MASASMVDWFTRWAPALPPPDAHLHELAPVELDAVADAYEDLQGRSASIRKGNGGDHYVTFGPAGVAKTLFVMRPLVCPPWDSPIRDYLRREQDITSYRAFLQLVRSELQRLSSLCSTPVPDLPKLVHRPQSSAPKLIDEYYWVVVTRGCTPPSSVELKQWHTWLPEP
jgi:hypothetical protein